jgi:hypothetical protein
LAIGEIQKKPNGKSGLWPGCWLLAFGHWQIQKPNGSAFLPIAKGKSQ